MKHLNPNTILKLVKKLEPYKDKLVCMEQHSFDDKNKCGCHASWWGYVLDTDKKYFNIHYEKGIDMFCEELGFESSFDLLLYFDKKSKIWGGRNALQMFGRGRGLEQEGSYFKVQVIIDKWKDVARRIGETE